MFKPIELEGFRLQGYYLDASTLRGKRVYCVGFRARGSCFPDEGLRFILFIIFIYLFVFFLGGGGFWVWSGAWSFG